jgi:predicted nuclease with RNAse H fold
VCSARMITAIGIDVGGVLKGFHAVAITGGDYANQLASKDVHELSHWCRETVQARVIAIDAPCHWSNDGHSRPAERELMKKGIRCFATPTREKAVGHRTSHFDWMLRGEDLYRAIEADFPVCTDVSSAGEKCCFETFPHAIAWHLRSGNAVASQKRKQRRALLEEAGIELSRLTNIDLIDAALCALTAYRAATGAECVSYGEPNTGLIIVPAFPPGSAPHPHARAVTTPPPRSVRPSAPGPGHQ